jgi:anti-repressor protein
MDNLITVFTSTVGARSTPTVNARSLHAFLDVKSEFRNWIKNRIEDFGFAEGEDYTTTVEIYRGGERRDYHITLDMAKELAMVERSAKGKQARQYFIECERQLKAADPVAVLNDPAAMRGLLLTYTEKVIALEQTIKKQAPAVEFANAIKNTADAITVGQMASVLGIGRNRFYSRLRADQILMADNLPYQHYKDRGYFRVIENVWIDDAKEPHPTFKTLITGRGQVYLQRKYGADTESAA